MLVLPLLDFEEWRNSSNCSCYSPNVITIAINSLVGLQGECQLIAGLYSISKTDLLFEGLCHSLVDCTFANRRLVQHSSALSLSRASLLAKI